MLTPSVSRHQGQVGAALVLGGVDSTGPHLFTVAPHGSTDKLPYVTMGSGSLAAMAVFESQWQKDLDVRIHPFSALPTSLLCSALISHHSNSFQNPHTARIRNQPRLRRDLRRYLQRSRVRFERRRLRDHRRGHRDAPEPRQAQRARAEGAHVRVPRWHNGDFGEDEYPQFGRE